MDLRQLRYFIGVAETCTFNGAAARMNVSQSSVSRRIRDLESDIGVKLFERAQDGTHITQAGRILLEHAKEIIQQVETTRREVREGAGLPAGPVCVGMSSACAQLFMSPLVRKAEYDCPAVQLRLVEGTQYHLLAAIETGDVDLALMVSPPSLITTPISYGPAEQLYFVRRPGKFPISGLADLAEVPMVLFPRPSTNRDYLDQSAAVFGVKLAVKYEISDIVVQKQLIRDGGVGGILPFATVADEVVDGQLDVFPISNLTIRRAIVGRRHGIPLRSIQIIRTFMEDIIRSKLEAAEERARSNGVFA